MYRLLEKIKCVILIDEYSYLATSGSSPIRMSDLARYGIYA